MAFLTSYYMRVLSRTRIRARARHTSLHTRYVVSITGEETALVIYYQKKECVEPGKHTKDNMTQWWSQTPVLQLGINNKFHEF